MAIMIVLILVFTYNARLCTSESTHDESGARKSNEKNKDNVQRYNEMQGTNRQDTENNQTKRIIDQVAMMLKNNSDLFNNKLHSIVANVTKQVTTSMDGQFKEQRIALNNMTDVITRIEENIEKLKDRFEKQQSTCLNDVTTNITEAIGKMQEQIGKQNEETRLLVSTTLKEVKVMICESENKTNEGLIDIKYTFEDKMEQLWLNSFIQGCSLFMAGIAVACLPGILKYLQKQTITDHDTPDSHSYVTSRNVRLKWGQQKLNEVGVVVFHMETQNLHVTEIERVFDSTRASPVVRASLVRRHADIEDLPGCKVYFVFVEFNERNVILEDPSKGLGDLRLTTVDSLLKFEADVFVIYCGDHGSINLREDLFNRNLHSVTTNHLLRTLSNNGRMLSISERFSERQRRHCAESIGKGLRV